MADTPTWSLVIDAAGKVITGLAVFVGGTIGYFRYLRGRVSHAKLDLEIEIQNVKVASRHALRIVATAQNAGTCRVAFPAGSIQEIQVSACFPATWADACSRSEPPDWDAALYFSEPFCDAGGDRLVEDLEPGQRFVRGFLVPQPTGGDEVAYRIRLYIEAWPKPLFRLKEHPPWSTERVFTKEGQ